MPDVVQPAPAASIRPAESLALEQWVATDPERAVIRIRELSAQNPTQARELGYRLMAALQKAGAYALAAEFAVAGPDEHRRDFTIAAYHAWGRKQPDQALAAAMRITEPTTLEFATQSVLSGWARADPEGMAEAALVFPEGEVKKSALTKALRAWLDKDPDIAGDWILAHDAAIPVADEFFTKDRR
jgi:hypothetical protein